MATSIIISDSVHGLFLFMEENVMYKKKEGGELDVFNAVYGSTNTAQNRKQKAVHMRNLYNGFKITYTVLGL